MPRNPTGTGGEEDFPVPEPLARACALTPQRAAWLERLPATVRMLEQRWSLQVGAPFGSGSTASEGSCAWVAPATTARGDAAVLKLGMPHFEGEHEIAGVRFWDGDGMVRLLAADEAAGGMLLERCVPGTPLRSRPPAEQDRVIAGLLRRLWRTPPQARFRPLTDMIAHWTTRALDQPLAAGADDRTLLEEGAALLTQLAATARRRVLLATDLHAGNVLRAQREPWLAIDPKPFVGDPAYDATQHLLNDVPRLLRDPDGTIRGMAELLEVNASRLRLWTFARLALGGVDPTQPAAAAAAARAVRP